MFILYRIFFHYVISLQRSELWTNNLPPHNNTSLRIVFRDSFTPEALYNLHVLWLNGDSVTVYSRYL